MNNVMKKSIVLLAGVLSFSMAQAKQQTFEVYRTKVDTAVKNCPKDYMLLANEILNLELAGLRWRSTKPACFESLKMKYVHAVKMPEAQAASLVRVKPGSAKVLKVDPDKEFNSQEVSFEVLNEKDEVVKSSFSFMTNTAPGGKKPKHGCVLIIPAKSAFVSEDCL